MVTIRWSVVKCTFYFILSLKKRLLGWGLLHYTQGWHYYRDKLDSHLVVWFKYRLWNKNNMLLVKSAYRWSAAHGCVTHRLQYLGKSQTGYLWEQPFNRALELWSWVQSSDRQNSCVVKKCVALVIAWACKEEVLSAMSICYTSK